MIYSRWRAYGSRTYSGHTLIQSSTRVWASPLNISWLFNQLLLKGHTGTFPIRVFWQRRLSKYNVPRGIHLVKASYLHICSKSCKWWVKTQQVCFLHFQTHNIKCLTFIIPFQLSPVDTRKRVKKAIPKFRKVACLPRPSHGWELLHSANRHKSTLETFSWHDVWLFFNLIHSFNYLPKSPNSSTPNAAKMKKSSMKRRPRFPTCGQEDTFYKNHHV